MLMNEHPRIIALIEKRLRDRGGTTPAEDARLGAHLARCPRCRDEAEIAALTTRVIRRLPRRTVSAEYERRFRKKAGRRINKCI